MNTIHHMMDWVGMGINVNQEEWYRDIVDKTIFTNTDWQVCSGHMTAIRHLMQLHEAV